jgi:hypothetical protein
MCILTDSTRHAPDVLDADGFRHLDGVPAAAGVQAEIHLLRWRSGPVHRHHNDAAMVTHLQRGMVNIDEPQQILTLRATMAGVAASAVITECAWHTS